MPDEHDISKSESNGAMPVGERERQMLERSMIAYARHVELVARYQNAVVEFRRSQMAYDALQETLVMLARSQHAAAESRDVVQSAVRNFVHVLRADARPPEIVIGLTKRAMSAIVVAMPAGVVLTGAKPLLDDAVRWAIEAYYDAA